MFSPYFIQNDCTQVGLQLCRGVDKLNSVVGDCVFNVFATNILVRGKVF